MREIPLTKGKFALVDDEDYDALSAYKWQAKKCKTTFYAHRHVDKCGKRIYIALHRAVMCASPGIEVDHRDGNGLNCQRANLRLCTHAQNVRNTRLRKDNSTGFKGVKKQGSRFVARIRFNKELLYLGCFKDPISAAAAYDAKARELFGEFAMPNNELLRVA